jgi:DNA recombination protein RmuC
VAFGRRRFPQEPVAPLHWRLDVRIFDRGAPSGPIKQRPDRSEQKRDPPACPRDLPWNEREDPFILEKNLTMHLRASYYVLSILAQLSNRNAVVMEILLLVAVLFVGLATLVMLVLLLLRRKDPVTLALDAQFEGLEKANERTERGVREELSRNREESAGSGRQLREEVGKLLNTLGHQVLSRMGDSAQLQKGQLESFAGNLKTLTELNVKQLELMREGMERKLAGLQADAGKNQAMAREESANSFKAFVELLLGRMMEIATLQKGQLETFAASLNVLTQSNEQKLEKMREAVEAKLAAIQLDNTVKLEQMRATVDEKLHATLEQRLGESFKIVSERLELVHKGLGEMQSLANGVGDLKKVCRT